jgi:hypothetical protein
MRSISETPVTKEAKDKFVELLESIKDAFSELTFKSSKPEQMFAARLQVI